VDKILLLIPIQKPYTGNYLKLQFIYYVIYCVYMIVSLKKEQISKHVKWLIIIYFY
jgi:hypothetical protein